MRARRHLVKPIAARVYERHLVSGARVHAWLAARPTQTAQWAFRVTLGLYPFLAAWSWGRVAVKKLLRQKPTVLWAPTPILTITEGSNVLEREGYHSETLVFTTYYITSDFDHNAFPLVANPACSTWFPNALFVWAMLRFDVFHFYFDGGLWSGMKIVPPARFVELPLLRLAGKRVIVSAYGADVRVKRYNDLYQPFNICNECPGVGVHCICDDRDLSVARFTTDWANVSLAMGDMHDFVPGSRLDVPYWPIDTERIAAVGVGRGADGPVRIAHSPNHREFKGTKYLLEAVDTLRARGHDVELDLIERVGNAEAKARYAQADIVVAQCLAGWIGYTELEAMAMGKPTVSFLRDDRYLADFPGSPVVSANPSQLTDALERLVTDLDLRTELGMQGRRWTEQYWSYSAVGGRYRELHQEIWSRNGLGRKVTRRVVDAWGGRGWRRHTTSRSCNPALSLDLDRLGNDLIGFWASREVRAMAVAAIADWQRSGGEPRGSYDDLCAATLADPQVDVQMVSLGASFAAARGVYVDDFIRALAPESGRRTTGSDVLDMCCRAVGWFDLSSIDPLAGASAERAVVSIEAVGADPQFADDLTTMTTNQLFTLNAYVAALSRRTSSHALRAMSRTVVSAARRRQRHRPFGGPDAR